MGAVAVGMAIPPRPGAGKIHTGWRCVFQYWRSQLQGGLWERHIAVLGAFATAHVDQQAGTVNVRDLQVGAFLKAQATGVDGGETHPIAQPFEVCQTWCGPLRYGG